MRLPHLELMSPAALKALSITALIPSGVRDGVFILLSIGVLISPQARAVSIVEERPTSRKNLPLISWPAEVSIAAREPCRAGYRVL